MNNIFLGIGFIMIGILVHKFSPNSKHNIGYVSLQLRRNKYIWSWSNRFFGLLCIIGSAVFLIASIILKVFKIGDVNLNNWTLCVFLAYIIISVMITEIYVFIKTLQLNNK